MTQHSMIVTSKTDEQRRADRVAARLAARHSDEWRAGGQALVEQRVQQQRAAIAERAAAAQRAAIEFWQTQCETVRSSTITRHVEAVEQWIESAAADQSVDSDEIAFDVLCSYITSEVLYGRASRARVATALVLLRSVYALDVADGLDTLQRLLVTVTPARHTQQQR